MNQQHLKSVCVFCGSRNGESPAYLEAAKELGAAIAQNGWRLVYGAGDVGLMGAVADAAKDAGGAVFGVIPIHLLEMEVGKTDISTFVVTEDMHERKKVMHMNSNAIVVLPGGAGSLEEFFEVLTWRQLALHDKAIFLVNVDGYWDPLLDMLDHIIAEGFADTTLRDFVTVAESVEDITEALAERWG